MSDSVFYWIGVGTVAITTLIVFSILVLALVGWLFARLGINRYADIGEGLLLATIHKDGEIVFDKRPNESRGDDNGKV